jgi:hypothetical protein
VEKPPLLKALMLWNSPCQAALPTRSWSPRRKPRVSRASPVASTITVKRAIWRRRRLRSPDSRSPRSVSVTILLRRPILRKIRMVNSEVRVVIPKPPSWTRAMTTTCPNALQWLPVSTTVSPVMLIADTAVNSAVRNEVLPASTVATGRRSRIVPRVVAAR